jgi:hypothetical protein
MNEREEKVGSSERHLYFMGGNRDKFTAMKVPRQCPLVLLVGRRKGKAFGSGRGRAIKVGARRDDE